MISCEKKLLKIGETVLCPVKVADSDLEEGFLDLTYAVDKSHVVFYYMHHMIPEGFIPGIAVAHLLA